MIYLYSSVDGGTKILCPCQNGAKCKRVGGKQQCVCNRGFSGKQCQISKINIRKNIFSFNNMTKVYLITFRHWHI